ncbi:MAG TPA: SDR family oxidoreductase [Gemmatimonadota bacterium]|nr:SDR family oxidoreductase [Gemmatimonadota bacterium]
MSPAGRRPVALVTGASSGIGLELARVAASRGHDLVLVARGESALRALAGELARDHGAAAHVVVADLALSDGPDRVVEAVEALGLEVDVLVNNAGFGLYGDFLDTDLAIERDMIAVNVTAPTALANRFAIPMARRGRGRILNVASTAAFQPGPRMAVYYASKAYVLSLSLALSVELAGTGVTVTCLAPGPVRTPFRERAQVSASRLFSGERGRQAEEVARAGWNALERGRRLAIPGMLNRVGATAAQVLPSGLAARVVAVLQPTERK